MSLRTRLLVGMVVLVAAGLAATAVVTYEEQRSFLLTRVHQQVLSAVVPVSAELRLGRLDHRFRFARHRPPFTPFPGQGLSGTRGALLPPGTFGELREANGHVLRQRTFSYGGSVAPSPVLPTSFPVSRAGATPRLFTIPARGTGNRYLAVAFTTGSDTTVVAVPLRETDQTLHRLIVVETLVGAAVILGLVVLGWLVIGLGLRPLGRIGRTASEIAGGDFSRRIAPGRPRTEIGRLGRSLNEMLAQIEHAFQDRRDSEERLRHFLADASHELRTPLASIRGYAELFRLGAADDPATLERAMARIEAEATRMGVLVEELLLLAQLDQDRLPVRVPVDLRELAAQVADDTRVVAPDRDIALTATGAAVVRGDADRLRQLLANLMRNAVVHAPDGSAIEIGLREEGPWVVLEVRDHGPGLPPDAGEDVFERFWRSESGRRRGRAGTGLGLAIVRAIVAAHGGEVSGQNAPGGGALFRVRLPLARDLDAVAPAPLSADSQHSPGPRPAESPTVSAP